MQAADGFVMSSLSEGLPLVLLEAMTARVPCVATSVGGIPELFSGGAGLLVPPQDPDGLANAMLKLAADPDERRRMSEVGILPLAQVETSVRVDDQYLRLFGLPPRWPPPANSSPSAVAAG